MIILSASCCSWRHTPLRKFQQLHWQCTKRSWRHTPLRKCDNITSNNLTGSWRHTPLRNIGMAAELGKAGFMAAHAI
ncbi:hypothetical protein [Acinetobacter sp. 3657]|uniref:hypothetical protein n=1 Tax=Acinetobacter sp. 3657 TaxID=2817764 RepID=UPI0032B7C9CD